MSRFKFPLGLLLGTVLLASVAADEPAKPEKKPASDAQATFERLKKLAGEWQLADPKDDASKDKTVVRYRVTAADSAVVETIFPDTAKEMVTVYTRDGDRIVLTHYCCCGNQPCMRAKTGGDKDELVFEFAGGGNLNPAKDTHMHNAKVRFVDADHLKSEWELYVDGKPSATHGFDIIRKK
jgi:hypothetical protein